MSVLILKNIATEGPGTIEDYLKENRIDYRIIEMSTEKLHGVAKEDILVMMGGPMSVNEEHLYPFLTQEISVAREFLESGKKVFGVCLGAQIMAKALGARVYAGAEKEIGWYDIEVVKAGLGDPLIKDLAGNSDADALLKRFKVFQWHGETFDLPQDAELLASSAQYPHQAFRYGLNAYAFQFHIEVKKEMVFEWLKDEPIDMGRLKSETELFYEEYSGRARRFYHAFFKGNE